MRVPVDKSRYFCSELVADCFVITGFVEPSAAVVYKPNATSPGALGRDPTFGIFVDILLPCPITLCQQRMSISAHPPCMKFLIIKYKLVVRVRWAISPHSMAGRSLNKS